jgi:hypothetical protein
MPLFRDMKWVEARALGGAQRRGQPGQAPCNRLLCSRIVPQGKRAGSVRIQGATTDHVAPDAIVRGASPRLSHSHLGISRAGFLGAAWADEGVRPYVIRSGSSNRVATGFA